MAGFEAKYRGKCGACEERIEVGDLVVFVDDVLVHEDCEGAALVDAKNLDVCPRCFLVRPCEHDDEAAA